MSTNLRKTVIHIHTDYSFDSNFAPAELVRCARDEGVDVLAVTDHDTIAGALETQRLAGDDLQVVIGAEISTADGHLIGLFLNDDIPAGLSALETARRIRRMGGVVLAPHPFCTLADANVGGGVLEELRPLLDGVEVFNAQNPYPPHDKAARRWSVATGVAAYAGADTHIRGFLSAAHQMLPAFRTADEFRQALRGAALHCRRYGPGYFARMAFRHYVQKVYPRPIFGFGRNLPAEAVTVAQ